ncbi:YggS family pyridoxal phosphate-dependent enzyme [Myroides sp. LoEW2-1]|uniref:YggS family pyridoxal phosphate-dependent enzyme n=1 Tax=Myroides sp. LoEW2-1 TaxID=2683192 RepID=UPI0013270C2D|nr:YggS family pyridoxal phosphate-dependent enzyme [Myroides sp. LoEW2-1]MVX35951.1 YggS family pyridoxal phosphate-dependent enzyme [Myroides sp. LoEW2-1]
MKENILNNLKAISNRIQLACLKSNRDPRDVKLLLATKTVRAEDIKIAIEAGFPLIGENKVQEVKEKFEILSTVEHQKHFIGHLQTNKIKDILKYDVNCIQSLDRIDLAEKLHQRLSKENKTIDVFIQVNTSNEESKFGISPEDAVEFTKQVAQFDTLKIKGLMTIGLFSAEDEKVRVCFKLLKKIQMQINELHIPDVKVNELSMGMSNDLEIAIEEGATIIRVGTAIFGQRIYPDSYYWNESK